jgi:hypothetical protein
VLTKTLGPADREPVTEDEIRSDDSGSSGRPQGV